MTPIVSPPIGLFPIHDFRPISQAAYLPGHPDFPLSHGRNLNRILTGILVSMEVTCDKR